MANEPDIKLLFGVEGGASIDQGSGKQIFDDLKEIVKGINGKDVLKVKVGLDDGSAKEFKDQIKGIMSGADSGVEVKVAGLDKVVSDAGRVVKALDGVATSAKKIENNTSSAFNEAKKAVNGYFKALADVDRRLGQDIFFDFDAKKWTSATREFQYLADALTEAERRFNAFTSAEARAALSIEQQEELIRAEVDAYNKYGISIEDARSKALSAADKSANRAALKAESEALNEASLAAKNYYSLLTKLRIGDYQIAFDGQHFSSAVTRNEEFVASLNRALGAFNKAKEGFSSLSPESQEKFLRDVTDAVNEYNLSVEEKANKDSRAATAARTRLMEADAYSDASRAIREYYSAQTDLAKMSERDIVLDGAEYKSISGNYAELARELTRTKIAYDTVVKSRESLPLERQTKLQALMTQEAARYNRTLEDQANKERLAAEAARDKSLASSKKSKDAENMRKEKDAFTDATRAVNEYYVALTKLAKQETDIFLDGSGYKSTSGNYAELAKELNRTKIAFDLVERSRASLNSEHQVKLQTQMTQEAARYNLVLEERANKERAVAEKSRPKALVGDTKEYNEALVQANALLIQLRNNQRNWSAASEGKGAGDFTRLGEQIAALEDLKRRLSNGKLTAEDFADEMSRIRSLATDAAESINKFGENHTAVEVLTKDTKEYNDALTKSYTLLGQVATHLKSWSASKTGESAPSYMSLSESYSDLEMLTSFLEEGVVDANTFALTFADIKRNVAEASAAIKVAGENMKAVDSPDVIERLARVNAELKEITVQNSTLTSQYKKITGGGPIDGVSVSSVDALKVKYQEMLRQTELLKVNRKTATDADITGVRQLQDEVQHLVFDINRQAEAVKKTSSVDKEEKKEQMASLREVIALYEQIDKYLLKNSRAEGTAQYESLRKIRDELYSVKQAGEAAEGGLTGLSKADLRSKVGEVRNLESGLRDAGREGNTLAKSIAAAYQKFGGWMLVTQSLTRIVGSLRDMVENVKQIDSAMTELKKVTSETDAVYDAFLTRAQEKASKLGVTVADTVTAAADFARLGHGIEDASALADAALVYKNVGDGIDDISTASQSIISTMQAFGYEADQAMLIVDKFNQVGNRYAVSSQGLGEILVRSAAAMASANNTLDETIALGTAANTILQNPEAVGTTMKTLSMYLRAAKTEAEEAGESTEGMAGSVSELRGEILSLTGGAVDIQINEDSFKSSYQILKELSQVWQELTDVSQANILEMIGGRSLPRCTVMCI